VVLSKDEGEGRQERRMPLKRCQCFGVVSLRNDIVNASCAVTMQHMQRKPMLSFGAKLSRGRGVVAVRKEDTNTASLEI
jgi:hypothetical protein